MVRTGAHRSTKKLWIFCEGQKTEKNYFSALKRIERIPRLDIKVNNSPNQDAEGIVEYAIRFTNQNQNFRKDDLVYCIFDCDANTNQQLEQAISKAERNNICLIFSNPSFEYWVVCHYQYCPTACDVQELVAKLNSLMGDYKKNDPKIYKKSLDKIDIAITHAKRIIKVHRKNKVGIIRRESNPVTLVFKLIEKINECR